MVGGGEPVLPGISVGHNEHGTWRLTIFRIDQEDIFVYKTTPDNPNQYLFEDPDINVALAMKAAWLDIGATPNLASLRMDQATSWEKLRDACSFSSLPGENMVWADKYGNIGWQSVGLTPVRFGWDGSLPVPGDGTYEWSGYVPIKSMPHLSNPDTGWYGTANHNNVPQGYPDIFADFYSDPARSFRLQEVLSEARNHKIEDSMALQYDNKSMTAEAISLASAVETLTKALGSNMEDWTYGQVHHAEIIHPLAHLLKPELRENVNVPANHGTGRQVAGASFRLIVDTQDWDKARGTNTPGQSGDPKSPFYRNTFEGWNKGEYFPVYYSKEKIKAVAHRTTTLTPP